MKEVTVIIDGEEYIARPKNEPVAEEKPKTGYERLENGEMYFTPNKYGECEDYAEDENPYDKKIYDAANYYNERNIAENIIRADTLMRKLRQWQALNDEPVDWSDENSSKWGIEYDYINKEFDIDYYGEIRLIGQIYFSSVEKAREAIEVFKDELTWYFTEYMQRLDEPKHN